MLYNPLYNSIECFVLLKVSSLCVLIGLPFMLGFFTNIFSIGTNFFKAFFNHFVSYSQNFVFFIFFYFVNSIV